MTILIARHGETDDNANNIVQFPSSPLSLRGKEQAKLLAQRIKSYNVTTVLSSDYIRTQETADEVNRITGVDITLNALLRERNFGDLRGKPYSEILVDPFAPNYIPPAGESWAEFYSRVAEAWDLIISTTKKIDGNLLVVTHGFVCKALIKNHLMLPKDVVSPSSYGNTALTEVERDLPWRVTQLNCVKHLEGRFLIA